MKSKSILVRLLESAVALVCLLLALPVIIVVAVLIEATSKGEIFVTGAGAARFRTFGLGGPLFRLLAAILRRTGIECWPGMWSVIWGKARLRDVKLLGRKLPDPPPPPPLRPRSRTTFRM